MDKSGKNDIWRPKAGLYNCAIFLHPDPTKPFHVEINASDFAIRAIISQPDEVIVLYPVAYYSRKFTTLEINYLSMKMGFSLSLLLSKNGGAI
jgi:hypothetical protein